MIIASLFIDTFHVYFLELLHSFVTFVDMTLYTYCV